MQTFWDWLTHPAPGTRLYWVTGFELMRAFFVSGGAHQLALTLMWALQHLHELRLTPEREQEIATAISCAVFALSLLMQLFQGPQPQPAVDSPPADGPPAAP